MTDAAGPLLVLDLTVAILGGSLTRVSLAAYRDDGSTVMLGVSVGIAAITLGTVADDVLVEVLHAPFPLAESLGAGLVALGFGTMLYVIEQ